MTGEQNEPVLNHLLEISGEVEAGFERQQRVLSFGEYLAALEERPKVFCRDASFYVRDMLAYYGTEKITTPSGEQLRYKLFDQPFLSGDERLGSALVAQESVVAQVAQILSGFARVGAPNRVLLLHGPNGSAKSTIASCLLRGLEDYSTKDEGAVYRYDWVFPKKQSTRGTIGFGGQKGVSGPEESFAHLPDEELDARVLVEVRDHPLFLLPTDVRRRFLQRYFKSGETIPRWLLTGSLCDKSQKIFQALLASSHGSLQEVLRHVRVERVFYSKRYRVGAVTLGPELSVDARERQLTMDQNLASLPISLQGLSLFEAAGELVDASGGILELSDMLKRPLDAFKYLQITAESGEVSLASQTLLVNTVLLASGNDLHLGAFREHPEFESFRGRLALVRVPYLLDFRKEQEIYVNQILSRSLAHVAPHASELAARFAVLTRLEKPEVERHELRDRPLVEELSAWQKLELYAAETEAHERRGSSTSLTQLTARLLAEWEGQGHYEGAEGVSPRTMRAVLLAASESADFDYLSPFSVLEQLKRLTKRKDDYSFLRRSPEAGGYHDPDSMLGVLRNWLFDRIEEDLSLASGLVEDTSYDVLIARYIENVSAWVKGEKLKNELTGISGPADETLMADVEELLRREGEKLSADELRHTLLGRIAAWSIDHPGERLSASDVTRQLVDRLRRAVLRQHQAAVADFCRLLVDEDSAQGATEKVQVAAALGYLCERRGYTTYSVRDAAARLIAERYSSPDGSPGTSRSGSKESSSGDKLGASVVGR